MCTNIISNKIAHPQRLLFVPFQAKYHNIICVTSSCSIGSQQAFLLFLGVWVYFWSLHYPHATAWSTKVHCCFSKFPLATVRCGCRTCAVHNYYTLHSYECAARPNLSCMPSFLRLVLSAVPITNQMDLRTPVHSNRFFVLSEFKLLSFNCICAIFITSTPLLWEDICALTKCPHQ